MVAVQSCREVGLHDRRRRLLGLEDQWVVLVAALEHEHEAARADAADPDDLEREIDEAVALQEVAPVLGHRGPVVREHPGEPGCTALGLDMGEHRRVVEEDAPAVDDAGQVVEGAHAVASAGLAEDRLDALAAGGARRPVSMPVAWAASRMSVSVIEAYQTLRRPIAA